MSKKKKRGHQVRAVNPGIQPAKITGVKRENNPVTAVPESGYARSTVANLNVPIDIRRLKQQLLK